MAYGTRWKIETVNPYNSHEVEVFIKERDYGGAVTDLPPGGDMIAIRYTPIGMFSGTPHWTLAASEATIEFIDDGTGQLSDVLSGDDEKYLVVLQDSNADMWQGYIVPDSYGYVPYNRGIARVTATDRLGSLFGSAYLQSTGYVYSGRQNLIEIIANCIQKISTALPFATHMRWYPYIGTNDLATTDNPLVHLFLDNEIFYDEDDNPMSCGYVLEQICGRFQMQLFQDIARWQLHQRRKTVASNLFTVFLYDSDGSPSVTPTTTYQAYTEIEGTTNRLASPYMTGSVPYGSVSVVYNHGNPFTDLFANLSFESVMHSAVPGSPLANSVTAQTGTSLIIDGLTGSFSIPAGMKFSIAGQTAEYKLAAAATVTAGAATLTLTFGLVSSVADNTAITFLEDVGNWQYDGSSGFPGSSPNASEGGAAIVLDVDFETSPFSYSATQYVRQRSREQVAGGSGYRINGGWDVFVPNLDDVTTELYMAFRAYIDVGGTPYYYKWSDSTWTTTNTKNEVPIKSYNLGNNKWETFDFTTGQLLDGATPLTGYFYFEFLEGHELNSGGSATTGLEIRVDNFRQPTLLDANYLPAGEATQTTITYDGNLNLSKPDVPQFIIGDGPTTAHVRRLTLKDSTLTDTGDITGSWKFGPVAGASGYTLDQFWADEMMKQYRRSARRLSTGVFSMAASGIVSPRHMLRITNPNDTDAPDYTWMDLEWRPAAFQNVVSGTFVELVDGDSGDLLCEYSVPGASVAALSLTLEQGIPCATGGVPIVAPPVFEYVYGIVGTSPDSSWVVRINRDEESLGSWSSTTLITHAGGSGKSFTHLRADEAAGYLFVMVLTASGTTNELRRYPITGGASYTSLWTGAAGIEVTGFDINRTDQACYISTYEAVAFANAYIKKVTYAGAETTLKTYSPTVVGALMGVAYDRTDLLFYYKYDSGADEEFRKIGVDGAGDALVGTVTESYFVRRAQANAASGVYMSHYNSSVYSVPIPGGGSKSTIQSSVTGLGVAVDWTDGMVYYSATTGGSKTVIREPIGGGTQVTVATVSTGNSFVDLDLGI